MVASKRKTLRVLFGGALLLALGLLTGGPVGCGSPGTSVLVQVDFDALAPTRLRLSGAVGDQTVFEPADRSLPSGETLSSPQTVRVL